MDGRRVVAALLLVLALVSSASVAASGASAEVPGTLSTVQVRAKDAGGATWAAPKSVNCSKVAFSANLKLVFPLIGSFTFRADSSNVKCNEATLEPATVEGVPMVEGGEKLEFTGVTAIEPAGCKVPATITTNALRLKIDHHYKNGVTTPRPWSTRRPASGETIATIKVTGCAAEGNYALKGVLAGTLKKETGVASANHEEVFNSETDEGGSLTVGGKAASFNGEINRELASGESFQTSE
ncbi:MAG TPA: hypothetical protein VN522_13320 [Solirubrobacterales bacterium]|nr:hypothetical protein [Solirubrobacterales bacterium]